MKYIFLLIFLVSGSVSAAEVNNSVGLGLPHAGLGYQFSVSHKKQKYYLSAGALVLSAGAEFSLTRSDKHTLGLSYSRIPGVFSPDADLGALNYTYYVNSFDKRGAFVGTSLFLAVRDEGEVFLSGSVEREELGGIFLSVGYAFN